MVGQLPELHQREAVVSPQLSECGQLTDLQQRLLAARGIDQPDQLTTELRALLPPEQMHGCIAAAELLAATLAKQGSLLVVGDFDADGATSSALAVLALRAMGARDVDYLVPNRFEYGYGLTPEIVKVAAARSPDLIITVDNGISSIEGVALARSLGIDVVVTDHHLAGAHLPDANVIVNPNQPACEFPSKVIAGVGVIFYLMMALRQQLRQQGWFQQQQLDEPNLADYLDLVALGTVADVVPLDQNNRILVEQGIRRIRAGKCRPGITALLEIGKRSANRLVSSDLGFVVGPRLNAAGRLDDMSLGIRCLLSDEPYQARQLAIELDQLNSDRRSIETGMQQEALQLLSADDNDEPNADQYGFCLYHPQWHQGVIGILASRLKEKYHRPVIVFADADQAGWIKGSARSIPGLHIRDTLDAIATRQPNLLQKFGGHAMAAGMSIERRLLEDFQHAFEQQLRRSLDQNALSAVVEVDGSLAEDDLNLATAEQLRYMLPWGQGFPEPLFVGEFTLLQTRVLAGKHLKMVLATAKNRALDAIAFNVDEALLALKPGNQLRVLYRLDSNEFRGQVSLQLMISAIEALP